MTGSNKTTATTSAAALPYEVVALLLDDQGQCGWRRLGRYPHLHAAVTARVADVMRQLTGNDGWLVRAEHFIIGPGPDGPATLVSCLTEIGADPASHRGAEAFDATATESWLLAAHGLPARAASRSPTKLT